MGKAIVFMFDDLSLTLLDGRKEPPPAGLHMCAMVHK